jgi:CDP-glucose 4,6-dehydratase
MNVLLTGGTGFIGSHLVNKLKGHHHVVILIRDIPSTLWGKWLTEALRGCTIVQGDILNQKLLRRILAEYRIEQVYHLAAQAIVSTALKDPVGTFETNVVGTANLLEACRQVEPDIQILVMSTDKIYGDNRMGVSEDDPLGSTIGIYETSKACEDIVARAFLDTYRLRIKIARSSNVYGYDMSPRIIPNTIRSCLRGESPVIFEGQEKTVRQYIYVEDLVDALIFIMGNEGVFNIGTDDILTQEEVVKKICSFFSMTPRYVKRDKPIKEIGRQSVNWQKLRNLGWTPKHSFEEGIQETIKRFERFGF